MAEDEDETLEALKSNADEEDALKNGDVHSNPVRVLDALTENNDAEQSVHALCNSTDNSRHLSLSYSSPGILVKCV